MDKINNGTITKIVEETNGIKNFALKLDKPFAYTPGQYIMLAYPDSNDIRRAFSVVSHDHEKNEITLLIRKVGLFTTRLFKDGIGSTLEVLGPYGRFCLPKKTEPLVLIAGGLGVTPIYSILLEIKKNGWKDDVHLFYSAKKRDEMILYNDLLQLDDARINMNFFFTRESGAGLNSGRIDLETIKKRVPEFKKSRFYICGPSEMTAAFREDLIRNNISDSRIISEEFY